MAENGSPHEHFRRAWPILLPLGCGLFWLGHNIVTPAEIDNRVQTLIRPLQDKTEWIEAEIRRREQREGFPAEAISAIERRIRILEARAND